MSCSYAKGAWEVRWRDATSRQRSQRFDDERVARARREACPPAWQRHSMGSKHRSGESRRCEFPSMLMRRKAIPRNGGVSPASCRQVYLAIVPTHVPSAAFFVSAVIVVT
jgi:hypothetical protein